MKSNQLNSPCIKNFVNKNIAYEITSEKTVAFITVKIKIFMSLYL